MKDAARLRRKDLKAWIPVDADVRILCRFISQSEWEEIRALSTETNLEAATATTTDKEDKNKFNALLAGRVVVDIEGLVDSDNLDDSGQPCPFAVTPENVEMLMLEWTEFRLAVRDAPLSFERMLALEQEQYKKN